MRTLITAVTCLVLLSAASGCGEDSEGLQQVQDGLGQAWKGLKTFTAETRDKAVPYFQKQLDGLDEQYEKAKKKAAALGSDASNTLQAKWADASKKLDEMKTATGESFEKAQTAFLAAYKAFQEELAKDE